MFMLSLTQGKFSKIDDEDSVRVTSHGKWGVTSHGYAKNSKRVPVKRSIYLHRFIMGLYDTKVFIDHINGDKLDNRKCNLRIATQAQNMQNVGLTKRNKSGYKGVCWNKQVNKWRVTIKDHDKQISIGHFPTIAEAALAYNVKCKELRGDFAVLNNIPAGTVLTTVKRKCENLGFRGIASSSENRRGKLVFRYRANVITQKHPQKLVYVGRFKTLEEAVQAQKAKLALLNIKESEYYIN